MRQTARIISTYSADVMGVCSALFELGGMVVMHDASGCNSTYTTHDEPRWYDTDSMIYISALTEMEALLGRDEKLVNDVCEAAEKQHPKFIAIAGTPIPAMSGFDFGAAARAIEKRTGIPAFGFPTTGMNTYIHGASMALAGIAERFVADPGKAVKEDDHIRANVLGLTPLDFSVNGTDRSICGWLESEGFEVVSRWAMGSTLEELSRAAEADVNLVVSASGLGAAKLLYEKFHIPYVVGIPMCDEQKNLIIESMEDLVIAYRCAAEGREPVGLHGSVEGDAGLETFDHLNCCMDLSEYDPDEWTGDMDEAMENWEGDTALAEGSVVIIGEGIGSLSLATAIEMEAVMYTKVLCATDCPDGILRDKDRMTPDEDDIIAELTGATVVIADPMYEPIVPEGVLFIALPHEAFSGRLYRDDIPDLVKDFDSLEEQLPQG